MEIAIPFRVLTKAFAVLCFVFGGYIGFLITKILFG